MSINTNESVSTSKSVNLLNTVVFNILWLLFTAVVLYDYCPNTYGFVINKSALNVALIAGLYILVLNVFGFITKPLISHGHRSVKVAFDLFSLIALPALTLQGIAVIFPNVLLIASWWSAFAAGVIFSLWSFLFALVAVIVVVINQMWK